MVIFLLLLLFAIVLLLKFYQRCNKNFSKDAPPVIQGYLPYFGDLLLYKPYLLEYIASLRKKYGDIFTIYNMGKYWTFIFREEDLNVFYNSPEKKVSGTEFLKLLLGPFQSVDQKFIDDVVKQANVVNLLHKMFNKTHHYQRFIQNIEKLGADLINNEWFEKRNTHEIDIFKEMYNILFSFNIANFSGIEMYENHRKEVLECFKKCEFSKVSPLKESLLRALGVLTETQKSYKRIGILLKPIIGMRKRDNFSAGDILDETIRVISKKIEDGSLKHPEHEIINFIIFQYYNASMITSSAALGWLLVNVLSSKDERILTELKREALNAPSPITLEYVMEKMPFTEACIYEAIRYGILGLSGRVLMKDTKLGNYTVPKGNVLFYSFHFTSNFKDPKIYNPFRFINDKGEFNNNENFHFTPFGYGRHPCAGRNVAKIALKTFLIVLFRNCRMEMIQTPEVAPSYIGNFNRMLPTIPAIMRVSKIE